MWQSNRRQTNRPRYAEMCSYRRDRLRCKKRFRLIIQFARRMVLGVRRQRQLFARWIIRVRCRAYTQHQIPRHLYSSAMLLLLLLLLMLMLMLLSYQWNSLVYELQLGLCSPYFVAPAYSTAVQRTMSIGLQASQQVQMCYVCLRL